jgi:toxin ParE1/3/4
MTSIYWTFEAIRDREQIYDRIEADNPTAAIDLDALFEQKSALLTAHTALGRPVV